MVDFLKHEGTTDRERLKCTSVFTCYLQNGSASVFCFFFAFIEYNLGIMNIQCIL